MITEPKIEPKNEQHTAGIRSQVPMEELPRVIPQCIEEVEGWLAKKGIAPAGAPFVRYHVIDMPARLDIEVGWPVASAVSGEGRIIASTFPAGRYATILYTGSYDGLMDANRVLVEWAEANGVQWDRWDDPNGDAFRSRYESYLTSPDEVNDPSEHKTEVAIKVANK